MLYTYHVPGSLYLIFIFVIMRMLRLLLFLLLISTRLIGQDDHLIILSRYVSSYDIPASKHIKLPAGDFKSDSVQFTIAIFDANNDSVWNTPATDMVVIAPYKADSVYTHIGCQAALIGWHKTVTVKAGKSFFRINCTEANAGKILVTQLPYDTAKADAMLFNTIPDIGVTLLSGKKDSLKNLLDKKKYTYVLFWGTWCQNCLESLNKLKKIYATYNSSVNIISMDFSDTDTNKVRKLVKEKGYNWAQLISDEATNEAFSQNGYPYGILFAPDGQLVKQGMSASQIPLYISPKRGDLNSQKQ
jgi:thiol-disulfide isomerase/thioredoxin